MTRGPVAEPRYPAHKEFVHKLGGPKAVAEFLVARLGEPLTPQAVACWYHRGVAWRYRALLVNLAVERGVLPPPRFLEAQPRLRAAA